MALTTTALKKGKGDAMDLITLILVEYSLAIFAIFLGWADAENKETKALVARAEAMLTEVRRIASCT